MFANPERIRTQRLGDPIDSGLSSGPQTKTISALEFFFMNGYAFTKSQIPSCEVPPIEQTISGSLP
jgi:hypothetical protein